MLQYRSSQCQHCVREPNNFSNRVELSDQSPQGSLLSKVLTRNSREPSRVDDECALRPIVSISRTPNVGEVQTAALYNVLTLNLPDLYLIRLTNCGVRRKCHSRLTSPQTHTLRGLAAHTNVKQGRIARFATVLVIKRN